MGSTADHFLPHLSYTNQDEYRPSSVAHNGDTATHYKRCKADAHEVMDDWYKDWPGDPRSVYHLGNALKYLCRAGHKGGTTIDQDLQKCLDCVNLAMDLERCR